jgi:hypothetical protein
MVRMDMGGDRENASAPVHVGAIVAGRKLIFPDPAKPDIAERFRETSLRWFSNPSSTTYLGFSDHVGPRPE